MNSLRPDAVSFVPVKLGEPNAPIAEPDCCDSLHFAPLAQSVFSSQTAQLSDVRAGCDRFDVRNWSQNLEVHAPCLLCASFLRFRVVDSVGSDSTFVDIADRRWPCALANDEVHPRAGRDHTVPTRAVSLYSGSSPRAGNADYRFAKSVTDRGARPMGWTVGGPVVRQCLAPDSRELDQEWQSFDYGFTGGTSAEARNDIVLCRPVSRIWDVRQGGHFCTNNW